MREGPRDFNICPSCGTEFGLHDVNSTVNDLRDVWVENGMRWYSRVIPQPEGWDPLRQMVEGVLLNAIPVVPSSLLSGSHDFSITIIRRRKRRVRRGTSFAVPDSPYGQLFHAGT